jgi:hypothetical protein
MDTRGSFPRREAAHSLPSSAEVKEYMELYLHSPSMPSGRDAQLKHKDNFTFSFIILLHYNQKKAYLGMKW